MLAPDTRAQARAMLAEARADGLGKRLVLLGNWRGIHDVPKLLGAVDPWWLAERSTEFRAGAGQELVLVAALLGKPLRLGGEGSFAGLDGTASGLRKVIHRNLLAGQTYRCPFTGKPISALEAVSLLADWRQLIHANRGISAVFGVARWKRATMTALLWGGSAVPWRRAGDLAGLAAGTKALVWAAKVPPNLPQQLAAQGVAVGEVEDGFIRSAGLGADCVPPLSVIVDHQGAHFDPSRASTLEQLLAQGDFTPKILARAAKLREALVAGGISKYAQGAAGAEAKPASGKRRVLVAGQVEDDRAMLLGGAGCDNRQLLERARALEPDAELIYKPHPDVEAGHRRGAIPDAEALQWADRIDRQSPIAALLGEVDGLHVISSLAGFEALCRGVAVTTHGVPFYVGWGLTRDLAKLPDRRGAGRTLDELVAATLITYPRYLDPVTRLPCPVEVLVQRMAAGEARVGSALVWARRAQGRVRRVLG